MKTSLVPFILFFLIMCGKLQAQQVADPDYNPLIQEPAYAPGKGSLVFIDEGHYNFHTKNGRYKAFADLLEKDGYVVKAYEGEFTGGKLDKGKILVISNALNKLNTQNWYLPNPSAFTKEEIETVKNWVYKGGSLFLIADHMPMAGAAQDLAAVFGFEFYNGFALDTLNQGPSYFNRKEKTLIENKITNGRSAKERVEQIATFTGQAFKIPEDATPVLVFNEKHTLLMPDTAWVFTPLTPRIRIESWSQGAYKKYGRGRIVAFGEAAMFTAQLAGPGKAKVGMNAGTAGENFQLLLNIIHWLDGKFD